MALGTAAAALGMALGTATAAGEAMALGTATGAALATGPVATTAGEALATGSGELSGADGDAERGTPVTLGTGAGTGAADADGDAAETTRGVAAAAGAAWPLPGLAIAKAVPPPSSTSPVTVPSTQPDLRLRSCSLTFMFFSSDPVISIGTGIYVPATEKSWSPSSNLSCPPAVVT
jgi:hypothetical protein